MLPSATSKATSLLLITPPAVTPRPWRCSPRSSPTTPAVKRADAKPLLHTYGAAQVPTAVQPARYAMVTLLATLSSRPRATGLVRIDRPCRSQNVDALEVVAEFLIAVLDTRLICSEVEEREVAS